MISNIAKSVVLFCATILLCAVSLHAQNTKEHVVDIKIYFPYDSANLETSYMENGNSLERADALLMNSLYISKISKIVIAAQSSPEGSVAYNTKLSGKRKIALKKYFTAKYPHIGSALWSFTAVAENWSLFHKSLVNDINIPDYREVVTISQSNREADEKERMLKALNGGKSWLYINEHILPQHRFGATMLFIPIQTLPKVKPLESVADWSIPQQKIETSQIALPQQIAPPMPAAPKEPKMLFALKTNLVLDALSVINLGVEVPIGNRFSVVGEVVYPWWRSWQSNFTMQIESYHAELKYWLGDRSSKEQLQGWYAGVYGGWGRYDIQPFSKDGVQGYLYDMGAEAGYSLPLSNQFNLEFNLGVGYTSTQYKEYYMAYDTEEYGDIKVIPYPWLNHKLRTILPTRCGVNLVWTIKAKRGR